MTDQPAGMASLAAPPEAWSDLVSSGHLSLGDTLIAARIVRICNEPPDSSAALALALALRAVREGSTALDLNRMGSLQPEQDDDPEILQDERPDRPLSAIRSLPSPDAWLAEVTRSRLTEHGVLRADLNLVYLDRYHADETSIAERLLARLSCVPPTLVPHDTSAISNADVPLNPEQQQAVDSVLRRATTVLTGGPGMGKTHAVGGVLRAIQASAEPPLRVALAAPTGKAAARLTESLTEQGLELADPATTLHRLLGTKFGTSQRFRHDRRNPLPHDLVIVDEASMISLSMMARLLEALPDTARLLLVGDPDQLASVEAGSVLRDVAEGLGPGRGVVHLVQEFRLSSRRADLARAFRRGAADDVLAILDAASAETPEDSDVRFLETSEPDASHVPGTLAHAALLRELALAGDREAAVAALGSSRLLCAHRTGPYGTRRWNRLIEQALAERWPDIAHQEMYVGRPILVTRNDYGLGVTNGDTGIVMRDDDHLAVAFTDAAIEDRGLSPWRLSDIETMHAMTVHKAQGSQADEVSVIVPPPGSRLLSREMLYTAATRARRRLTIVGTREAVRAAVEAPAERSSGLARRLQVDSMEAQ